MKAPRIDEAKWFDALRWLVDVKQGLLPLALPILDDRAEEIGVLRPITVEHLRDEALLERFVVWRNQHRAGYLDQRPVTLDGVRRYVEDVVYNPTRLTFLAYCDGRPIARLGAVRIGPEEHESDGLVRGERGGGRQLIHRANITLIVLLFRSLNHRSEVSRVLSTNELARLNVASLAYDMRPVTSHPIYRVHHDDGDTLETSGSPVDLVPGVTLDTFRVHRESFFECMRKLPGVRQIEERIAEALEAHRSGTG